MATPTIGNVILTTNAAGVLVAIPNTSTSIAAPTTNPLTVPTAILNTSNTIASAISAGAIAGIVIASLAGVVILALLGFWLRIVLRRRKRDREWRPVGSGHKLGGSGEMEMQVPRGEGGGDGGLGRGWKGEREWEGRLMEGQERGRGELDVGRVGVFREMDESSAVGPRELSGAHWEQELEGDRPGASDVR